MLRDFTFIWKSFKNLHLKSYGSFFKNCRTCLNISSNSLSLLIQIPWFHRKLWIPSILCLAWLFSKLNTYLLSCFFDILNCFLALRLNISSYKIWYVTDYSLDSLFFNSYLILDSFSLGTFINFLSILNDSSSMPPLYDKSSCIYLGRLRKYQEWHLISSIVILRYYSGCNMRAIKSLTSSFRCRGNLYMHSLIFFEHFFVAFFVKWQFAAQHGL